MASNSGWSKEVPSGSSSIAKGDDDIRSFKSFMEAWWEQEHFATDGSAASAGVAKHGAGRAFVGTKSQLSNPTADNDGRLFFATDTGEMHVAQLSTSSWSVFADNINLGSQQTWTALQEFTSGISTNDIKIGGLASQLISAQSVLASDFAVAAGLTDELVLFPTTSSFRTGDPMMVGAFGQQAVTEERLILQPYVRSGAGRLVLAVYNGHATSLQTLTSGTTITIVGFRLI